MLLTVEVAMYWSAAISSVVLFSSIKQQSCISLLLGCRCKALKAAHSFSSDVILAFCRCMVRSISCNLANMMGGKIYATA
ncbi:hypothetical protein NXW60_18775 [Bacteroides fragilis]|nr:hypothetical protein NXW60_18775 [Bacteroides fragilis]